MPTLSSPSLPQIALVAPDPAGADPTELVAALLGGAALTLPGFADHTALKGHWLHPAVPLVAAGQFDAHQPHLGTRRLAWRRTGWVAAGLLVASLAFAGGVAWATYTADWLGAHAAGADVSAPVWSIVDVTPAGVMIVLGGSPPILVPVGAKLPNGDAVVSVAPERGTAYLESTTVVLRAPMAPLAPAAKESAS